MSDALDDLSVDPNFALLDNLSSEFLLFKFSSERTENSQNQQSNPSNCAAGMLGTEHPTAGSVRTGTTPTHSSPRIAAAPAEPQKMLSVTQKAKIAVEKYLD